MKRYLYIGEEFDLAWTDDKKVLAEWIEYGYMIVDTQEGKQVKYDSEGDVAPTWEDIEEGKFFNEDPESTNWSESSK